MTGRKKAGRPPVVKEKVFYTPFISHGAMREMIAGEHPDRWKMATVRKAPDSADPYAHHLLIDEATMGKTAWREMGDAILGHLV